MLHIEEDKRVKRLFYVTVYSLMMGQLGLKHVEVDVLKHKCDSNELYSFVASHCNNTIDILYMHNVLVERKVFLLYPERIWDHPALYLVGSGASSSDIK